MTTFEERFWNRVDKGAGPDACWPWTGGTTAKGHGIAKCPPERLGGGAGTTAHRIAYMLLVGPIPDGMHLDHLCRNPPCCNPAHLEPVTPAENQRRGLKGELRTHCVNGHAYLPDNLIVEQVRGGATARRCKRCRREQEAARRVRDRQPVPALIYDPGFGDGRLFSTPPAEPANAIGEAA